MRFTIAGIISIIAFGFMIAMQGELPDIPERVALGVIAGGAEGVAILCLGQARRMRDDRMRDDGKRVIEFVLGMISLMVFGVVLVLAQDLSSLWERYGVVTIGGIFQLFGVIRIGKALRE